MWYLVVSEQSERFFIKKKDEYRVYFVKEGSDIIEEKFVDDLSMENFKMVGEAFEDEIKKLEKLMIA